MVKTELWDKMGQSKEQQGETFEKFSKTLPVGFVASPFASNASELVSSLKFAAKKHQDSFWHDKAMIPFVKAYNDGIKSTGMTRTYLGYLTVGWAASAAIEAAGLFSQ